MNSENGFDLQDVFCRLANYASMLAGNPVIGEWQEGQITSLSDDPPKEGIGIQAAMNMFEERIGPGLLRWNSPNFMGYFSSSASLPALVATTLGTIHNSNRMLTSANPAAPELDYLAGKWYQKLLNIPLCFEAQWYYGASQSFTHFLAMSVNHKTKGRLREKGLVAIGQSYRIYKSELAHFFVEKTAISSGIGLENIVSIPTNSLGEMDVTYLVQAIENDIKNGYQPLMVIATVGTTSVTSIDPINSIADVCEKESLFLYVDAAYAGAFAALSEFNWIRESWERADAICINPHKQLMVPLGCSLLFVKDRHELRRVCQHSGAYIPEATTQEGEPMDFTFYCGMPINSLAPFFNILTFGTQGIQEYLRRTVKLAKEFEFLIKNDPIFTMVAPRHFSTVCFRAQLEILSEEANNYFNSYICEVINRKGQILISRTTFKNKICLRLTIGNIDSSEEHIKIAYKILRETAEQASRLLSFRMLANNSLAKRHKLNKSLLYNRFWLHTPKYLMSEAAKFKI